MELLYSDEPIIACSSGNITNNAISLIRFSGFKSLDVFRDFFTISIGKIKPRFAHYTKLSFQNKVYDEIILTFFPAPKSYTGENLLEISVHGNLLNIQRIIDLFTTNSSFRISLPGEFTYRALKNNKLSLSQVEGLDLLLNANSQYALDQGFSLLSGSLQKDYLNLYNSFLNHKSSIELSLDFLEDVGEENANAQFIDSLEKFLKLSKSFYHKVNNEDLNFANPEIVLVGLPNAGKSSLFNILLSNNRAIVSDVAGTTRDYLTETIKIRNVFYKLIDTAGIRTTSDKIEHEGINKTLELIDRSFFKILVINPFEFNLNFFKKIDDLSFDLILFTHFDKEKFSEYSQKVITELNTLNFELGPIEPINFAPIEANKICGPIGADLNADSDKLILAIQSLVNNKYLKETANNPIIIDRHREVVNRLYLLLCNYKDLAKSEPDFSILSHEFNIIGHCISELIGIISPDDVLHNIFNNFCIGK